MSGGDDIERSPHDRERLAMTRRTRRTRRRFASLAFATTTAATSVATLHAQPQRADPLHVVVTGPIDRESLRTQVAKELGRGVAFVAQCPSTPCLEIAIAAGRASV